MKVKYTPAMRSANFSMPAPIGTKKDQIQDKQIVSLKRKVKKLEKSEELKYKDTYYTTALTAAGALVSINPLAQGDDFNQRIGESVVSKYLNFKARFERPGATTSDQIRITILWDHQFNGVGGSISALLDGIYDNATITSLPIAPLNYRCNERYKVLYDKLLLFNPQSSTTDMIHVLKKNINLHGMQVKYADSGATFASIVSRALLFFVSSTNTAILPRMGFRYWFTDA